MSNYYTVKKMNTEISVKDYCAEFVDVAKFYEYCKDCPSYNKTWSCPEFDFEPMDIWNSHTTLLLFAAKIDFEKEFLDKNHSAENYRTAMRKALKREKKKLARDLLELEARYPGSVSLLAGSCAICSEGSCARLVDKPCKHPEQMRHSLESIGGDVGKTTEELFGVSLQWVTGDMLPEFLMLTCGLLV